jgi:hypothetical protein
VTNPTIPQANPRDALDFPGWLAFRNSVTPNPRWDPIGGLRPDLITILALPCEECLFMLRGR